MNRQRLFAAFVVILMAVALMEWAVLTLKQKKQQQAEPVKQAGVWLTGLPDLALSTEARFIRHRSLSGFHALFSEEGTLPEYFPSAFTYAVPSYQHAGTRIAGE